MKPLGTRPPRDQTKCSVKRGLRFKGVMYIGISRFGTSETMLLMSLLFPVLREVNVAVVSNRGRLRSLSFPVRRDVKVAVVSSKQGG